MKTMVALKDTRNYTDEGPFNLSTSTNASHGLSMPSVIVKGNRSVDEGNREITLTCPHKEIRVTSNPSAPLHPHAFPLCGFLLTSRVTNG